MDADVLIVGGGLSGLVAAGRLEAAGLTVTVLDKGKSVGGRMATRRIANGQADHGAQFFTVRTDVFQKQVDVWLQKGLVKIWGHGWSDGSLKRTVPDGHPRYVALNGMNSLPRDLASDLRDVRTETKIEVIEFQDGLWQLTAESGQRFSGRGLILTPPAPQSLTLLDLVPLTPGDRAELERIMFGPCLCGLHVVEGDIRLPEPGAIQNFSNTIYWVADNQQKGISPKQRVITTHAEARWSRQNYDLPDEDLLPILRSAFEDRLSDGATIIEEQVKRWRYSVPLTTYPRDMLVAEGLPLAFAGDAFGGRGRMEGAFLSGMAVGNAFAERFTTS